MAVIFFTAFSGLIATLAMSLYLGLVFKDYRNNPLYVFGFLTASNTSARPHPLSWGVVFHFLTGILFSYLYLVFVMALMPEGPASAFFTIYTALGFAHGFVFTLLLGHLMTDLGVNENFQHEAGKVLGSYLVAHLAYGVTLGALLAHNLEYRQNELVVREMAYQWMSIAAYFAILLSLSGGFLLVYLLPWLKASKAPPIVILQNPTLEKRTESQSSLKKAS